MAEERFILTRSGYELLKRELAEQEQLYQQHLEEFADVNYDIDPIAVDAAYFDRRVTKEHTEEKIGHLRLVLERAEVIDEDPDLQTADPGDRVTVRDLDENETLSFDLLGSSTEVIYARDGISIESPVGKALLGRRVGDVVEVETPEGITRYTIRNIERIPEDK